MKNIEKKKSWLEKFSIAVIVLSILVIAESLWVVNKLNQKLKVITPTPGLLRRQPEKPTQLLAKKVKLYFRGPSSWNVGEQQEVEVVMVT
jgi:hypothetical protein